TRGRTVWAMRTAAAPAVLTLLLARRQDAIDSARLGLHREAFTRERRAVAVAQCPAALYVADEDGRIREARTLRARRLRSDADLDRANCGALASVRASCDDKHERRE